MTDLDALLAGIVAHPDEYLRWLIVADWLEDHAQPERAELLRLHRMLLDTCLEPDAHPDRAVWQARIVELIDRGVKPCVPQHTLMLPGGVPLVGNFIPPGSFLMGGVEDENEKPIHKVTLTKGFFLGIYPVTEAQWRAATDTEPPYAQGDDRPVGSVGWEDATRFCEAAKVLTGCQVRLPSEAEWEYACRAGTTSRYHWGDGPDAKRMSCYSSGTSDGAVTSEFGTTALGTFASNPWGLFDCHGCMLEWCLDWLDWGFYKNSPERDPTGPGSGQMYRVARGGAWTFGPEDCRAASRSGGALDARISNYGIRVVFHLD